MVTYHSTRGSNKTLSFDEVILSGIADDKGLYLPDSVTLENLSHLTQEDLSYEDFVKTVFIALDKSSAKYVDELSLYSGFEVSPEPTLLDIDKSTVFMELFRGPTKSFKDYALQPLGAIANKRLEELGERGLVIVATSGDTGSAAIHAVKDSDNIDIVVLHPNNKISEYQRKQMSTVIQPNVLNIAVEGSYDDCQKIAKELLSSNPFKRRIISLNSINWLRVMGQLSYYVWLTKQFSSPINIAIPSGNFGNAYSAWYGRKHGLPINKILCSTNINDVLRRFIESGVLEPQQTQPSLSPSMDIQIPSSLERLIFDLVGNTSNFYNDLNNANSSALSDVAMTRLQSIFSSSTYLDGDIEENIKHIFDTYGLVLDPHSVTAVNMALHHSSSIPTVAVGTASPEKFSNVVASLIDDFQITTIEGVETYKECSSEIANIVEATSSYFSQ